MQARLESWSNLKMLRIRLNDSLKEAMKTNNRRAVSTLRLILAALKERDIAHRTQEADEEGVGEEEILNLLQSMIKQRYDSIEAYNKGGRKDLADGEAEEIEIIKGFLPEQMSEDAVEKVIHEVISISEASSIKDMGKVMRILRGKYSGRMDFGKVSALVKEKLS